MRLKDYDADWPQETQVRSQVTQNALFAVRIILKYFIQKRKKEDLIRLIESDGRDLVVEATRSSFSGKLLDIDHGKLL